VFTNAPEFRLWIARNPEEEPPFRLRWQVMAGRGTMLLPRGAGLDSAPASSSGTLNQLDRPSLENSRFFVVSDRGTSRNHFALGPFEAEDLEALETGKWHPLEMGHSGALQLHLGATTIDFEPSNHDPGNPENRIAQLESNLGDAHQRVSSLTQQIAALQDRIEDIERSPEPSDEEA